MWWNTKRGQQAPKDPRIPVCDVLLPLSEPRGVGAALALLYRLQSQTGGLPTLAFHMEPNARSTLRIRGFRGVDLDMLAGCLRPLLSRFNPTVCLTLSYKPGCSGVLARKDGGVLQISASSITSHALSEDVVFKYIPAPAMRRVDLPETVPTLH